MKKLFKLTALLLSLCLIFTACESKAGNTNDLSYIKDLSLEELISLEQATKLILDAKEKHNLEEVTVAENVMKEIEKIKEESSIDTTMKGPEEIMTEITEKEIVLLTLEDGRTIKMEVYPEIAPISVDLFLRGVETGYYNGKVFHRAVPGFMIQGGSKTGDGIGGMDETIKGEFLSNGVVNNLSHKRGVVSLARTSAPNSASGQFFIMHDDGEFLDGNYAAFGMVTEGMEVVDEIAEMPTEGETLIEKPVIASIEIVEE